MKVYDISQELISCKVFPGDPPPRLECVSDMKLGALYNLSNLSMCVHNGTHVDAQAHFYADGKRIGQLGLEKCIGPCYVYTKDGVLSKTDALNVIEEAKKIDDECYLRLLFRGNTTVSEEAAEEFAKARVYLVGNESQTVGPEDAPMKVHHILLKEEVVLLEGIRLSHVKDGRYILNAAPLNIANAEGAPCRAVLLEM